MVARPSLKRVVPGSVPPWRALCAESARALKAFFSVLCVSKSVFAPRIQVRADIARAKLARFLGQALVPAGAAGPRRSFCGLAVARLRVVPGSFPPASACFSWPRRCFGLPHVFRGRAVFHFRQSRRRGSLSSSLRLIRSLSTFAVEGCFMKRFSADVVSCAQKLAATLCPCNVLLAACQFVLFAARRFLQFVTYFVGRAAC